MITNLHNPSGVLTPDNVLREIADIARSVNALLLVDEVYLDAVYEDTPRNRHFTSGRNVVVTNSLTKVYGLSGLRCGWILARARPGSRDLAVERSSRRDSCPSRRTDECGRVRTSGRDSRSGAPSSWKRTARCSANSSTRKPTFQPPAPAWARPRSCASAARAEPFLERLRSEYETSAVPGRFFEMPNTFASAWA